MPLLGSAGMRGRYSGEFWVEHKKAQNYLFGGIIISLIAAWFVATFIAIPAVYVLKDFTSESWDALKIYYRIVLTENPFVSFLYYVKWFGDFAKYSDTQYIYWLPITPLAIITGGTIYTYFTNPYNFGLRDLYEAKDPTAKECEQMGVFGSKYFFFGEYKQHYLKLDELYSCLLVGTTGSGKTNGVIIPSILESDSVSMIVNDYGGEYWDYTSAYRATFTEVFRYQWDKLERPELGEFNPNMNYISPKNMPPLSTARAGYIAGLVMMLLPSGKYTDPYWEKNARAALEGFIHYLLDKVAQAKANDYFLYRLLEDGQLDDEDLEVLSSYYNSMDKGPHIEEALKHVEAKDVNYDNYEPIGTWEHIPRNWRGHEASFGLLIDFYSNYLIAASTELKARRDMGDLLALKENPQTMMMTSMLDEAVHFGYSRRSRLEVSLLLATPPAQRSSILSMALSGISIFKNPGIRQRTSSSDFYFRDLRGKLDPTTGEYKPITIYFMNNHGTTANINSIFSNLMCEYVLHYPPNSPGHGPLGVIFMMDNFTFLTTTKNLFYGYGTGRSKGVGFLFSCMSLHDVAGTVGGPDGLNVFIGKAAVKLIKTVNNEKITARFSAMSGNRTLWNVSGYSRPFFMGQPKDRFTKKVSEKMRAKAGISKGKMNNIEPKVTFMMIQHYLNRPIKAKSIDSMKSPRFTPKIKMGATEHIPQDVVKARSPEDLNVPIDLQFDTDGTVPQKVEEKGEYYAYDNVVDQRVSPLLKEKPKEDKKNKK